MRSRGRNRRIEPAIGQFAGSGWTRRAFSVALIASPVTLTGCASYRETYRYRLTLEVVTPSGPKHASSVIEVSTSKNYAPGYAILPEVRGEAVVLPLDRGAIYVLLENTANKLINAYSLASRVFADKLSPTMGYAEEASILRGQTERRVVAADDLLTFLLIQDPEDPSTIEVFDPAGGISINGGSVRVRALTLQMTTDAVTQNPPSVWPHFLSPQYQAWLQSLPPDDPRHVNQSDFQQER